MSGPNVEGQHLSQAHLLNLHETLRTEDRPPLRAHGILGTQLLFPLPRGLELPRLPPVARVHGPATLWDVSEAQLAPATGC